jgi:predicted helicase
MIASDLLQLQANKQYLQNIAIVKKLFHFLPDIAKNLNLKSKKFLDSEHLNNHFSVDEITKLKSIFKEKDISFIDQLSDFFTQIVVYGTFTHWIMNSQKTTEITQYSIKSLESLLPGNNLINNLIKFLINISIEHIQEELTEIEELFQNEKCKIREKKAESIISTYYSDFLKIINPKKAKEKGIVYTPYEIVEFMIDGINTILHQSFKFSNGILSSINQNLDIKFFDPAAGTMAFANGLLDYIFQEFTNDPSIFQDKIKNPFHFWVVNQFMQTFESNEISPIPFILGQLRTYLKLQSLGINKNTVKTPLKINLENSLRKPKPIKNSNHILTNENSTNPLIILGNPPYNISSQNTNSWITGKIQDYKKGLKEKNMKILSDDYVKFIRFAQLKIERNGSGILSFITNNKYLDGQMFSIMRKSLRKTFDQIYIVNFHGDMRKKEGGNPFDIRVGVAIAFMVRINNSENKNATIHYMDVPQSTRESKFKALNKGFQESEFTHLQETRKNYFIDFDTTYLDRFDSFRPINSFFKTEPKSGIMVGKDHLLIDVDKENLTENLTFFFHNDFEKLDKLKIKTHDTKSWNKEKVFNKTNLKFASESIQLFQYRGFDFRHLAYDQSIVEGHRMGYINQISHKNPAITVTRSSRKPYYCTSFITNHIYEKCYMSVTDTAYGFPLQFNGKSNIIIPKLPYETTDEDIFYYIYGVLFAKTYRERYDEYLRKSPPRIPLCTDSILFHKICKLGKKLADFHLLKIQIDPSFKLADIPPECWIIKNFYFNEVKECLYFHGNKRGSKSDEINSISEIPWISGITKDIWNYKIGNILQLEQFLKSRKFSKHRKWNSLQRGLNQFELTYFLKICTSIKKTLEILPIIDKIYAKIDSIDCH